MGVALGAGWGQPGPRGRGLNGAMLGSGVKWIRDGRGLSLYVRALLVKMIKTFANGNGFLCPPLHLQSLFFHLTFLSIIELSEFLLD